MGAGDLVAAAVILGLAVWLLWRSAFRRGGGCAGCSGAGCGRPPEHGGALVKLGRRGR
ncbi:conserved hypothetical protein [Anaeromyxobacter dehalogenans 2CP-1]|uniref:FeoB-associated Cys-rich membrane protein n=1 Tax=Anaeromyxobacter dehalogenans (strain ATCC BAA-258 / DSM 21875 / 2CP-1) TaxID=455488 RepID=B8JHN2_ANAD2|nr:hypothetical protein [Anaeromyxobacter dehalogenans]ACL66744.1 conserved hypothetical protein [Anaeromyxobacter dehalogenans 2CP-1]